MPPQLNLQIPPLWGTCINFLRSDLNDTQFNSWIAPLKAEVQGKELVLLGPSKFFIDYIKSRFLGKIQNAIMQSDTSQTWKISFDICEQDEHTHYTESKPNLPNNQITKFEIKKSKNSFKHNLNKEFTFENYIKGKANQLPYEAAMVIADKLVVKAYNPFFIYGGVGLGKTHLLHAIGNNILAKKTDAKVLYKSSDAFVKSFVDAIKNNKIESFQKFYRSLDVLLIDDIQFLAKKTQSQEEIFQIYNKMISNNKQIVITSDELARNVEDLDSRLQSRFGSALSLPIDPPELEMRIAILKNKAERMNETLANFRLPDDVAFFLAQNIIGSVRDLEGALTRLGLHHQLSGTTINMELCQEQLRDLIQVQHKIISIDNIQKHVCEYFKVQKSDLLSKDRSLPIVRPRQIAIYLCKELTQKSTTEIGRAFGKRDHSTVIHSCKSVKNSKNTDASVASYIEELKRKILE